MLFENPGLHIQFYKRNFGMRMGSYKTNRNDFGFINSLAVGHMKAVKIIIKLTTFLTSYIFLQTG